MIPTKVTIHKESINLELFFLLILVTTNWRGAQIFFKKAGERIQKNSDSDSESDSDFKMDSTLYDITLPYLSSLSLC